MTLSKPTSTRVQRKATPTVFTCRKAPEKTPTLSLSSFPNDVLVHIFKMLCVTDTIKVDSRAGSDTSGFRDAYSLSQVNSRFFHLFRMLLTCYDANASDVLGISARCLLCRESNGIKTVSKIPMAQLRMAHMSLRRLQLDNSLCQHLFKIFMENASRLKVFDLLCHDGEQYVLHEYLQKGFKSLQKICITTPTVATMNQLQTKRYIRSVMLCSVDESLRQLVLKYLSSNDTPSLSTLSVDFTLTGDLGAFEGFAAGAVERNGRQGVDCDKSNHHHFKFNICEKNKPSKGSFVCPARMLNSVAHEMLSDKIVNNVHIVDSRKERTVDCNKCARGCIYHYDDRHLYSKNDDLTPVFNGSVIVLRTSETGTEKRAIQCLRLRHLVSSLYLTVVKEGMYAVTVEPNNNNNKNKNNSITTNTGDDNAAMGAVANVVTKCFLVESIVGQSWANELISQAKSITTVDLSTSFDNATDVEAAFRNDPYNACHPRFRAVLASSSESIRTLVARDAACKPKLKLAVDVMSHAHCVRLVIVSAKFLHSLMKEGLLGSFFRNATELRELDVNDLFEKQRDLDINGMYDYDYDSYDDEFDYISGDGSGVANNSVERRRRDERLNAGTTNDISTYAGPFVTSVAVGRNTPPQQQQRRRRRRSAASTRDLNENNDGTVQVYGCNGLINVLPVLLQYVRVFCKQIKRVTVHAVEMPSNFEFGHVATFTARVAAAWRELWGLRREIDGIEADTVGELLYAVQQKLPDSAASGGLTMCQDVPRSKRTRRW